MEVHKQRLSDNHVHSTLHVHQLTCVFWSNNSVKFVPETFYVLINGCLWQG